MESIEVEVKEQKQDEWDRQIRSAQEWTELVGEYEQRAGKKTSRLDS
ncbi:MAG: hypothetical protein SynsKO_13500 [Synoicihabitans sp.]